MIKPDKKEVLQETEIIDVINQMDKDYGGKLRNQIISSITDALNNVTLLPVVSGRISIANENEAILRIETLYLLIDNISKYLQKEFFDIALKRTGNLIGRSFAYTLINLYDPKNICKYDSFTKLWSIMDGRYGWGNISFSKKRHDNGAPTLVEIQDSFIADDGHKRCKFMEGYIKGVLDEGFRYSCYELYKHDKHMMMHPRIEIKDVKETLTASRRCSFTITYSDEKFIKAYELLFTARESIIRENWRAVYTELRAAIESSLKEYFGAKSKSSISGNQFLSLLKSYKIQNLEIEEIKHIFDFDSGDNHTRKIETSNTALHFQLVSRFLNDLNETVISEDQKNLMKDELNQKLV